MRARAAVDLAAGKAAPERVAALDAASRQLAAGGYAQAGGPRRSAAAPAFRSGARVEGRGQVPGARDYRKLECDLLAALQPHVQLALTGLVYGYYLRPDDLLVSEDPRLLRRHRFAATPAEGGLFALSAIRASAARKLPEGGFAEFQQPGRERGGRGGGLPEGTEALFAAEVGSIRAVNWSGLTSGDLRVLGLRIRLAREWILRSSNDTRLRADLAAATQGILSARRRADLLNGTEAADWKAVWQAVTESDLYFISDRYFRLYSQDAWESAVAGELRKALREGAGRGLTRLGPTANQLRACGHPHLVALGPYEEYERHYLPHKLGERAAELPSTWPG